MSRYSFDLPAGRSYRTVWAASLLFFGAFYALLVPVLCLETIALPDWQIGLVLENVGLTGLYVPAALLSVAATLSAPLLSGKRTPLLSRRSRL